MEIKDLIKTEKKKILLEASGCHIHLTSEAVEILFGKGKKLTKRRDLSQPGEFLCEERLKLIGKSGFIDHVAVLGPVRNHVQVELSRTDCRRLGVNAPVSLSGDLSKAEDITIAGPAGELKAAGSAIVARNHIHMRPQDGEEYGVKDRDKVDVLVQGERTLIFKDVPVRISSHFMPVMHIDFDEANACGFQDGTEAFILKRTECREKLEEIIRQVVKEMTLRRRCAQRVISGKKLITEADAKWMTAEAEGDLSVEKGTIITPAAKDWIRSKGRSIRIV